MWSLVKSYFFSKPRPPAPPPSETELQEALAKVDELARPANCGRLLKLLPDRATSRWGGELLGAPGEHGPKCLISGRGMHPVFQVRVDELPVIPEALRGVALLVFWMDLEMDDCHEASNGNSFMIRTYSSLEGLVPIHSDITGGRVLPVFGIQWNLLPNDMPDLETFDDLAPGVIRHDKDTDWFFSHPYRLLRDQLRYEAPLKVGGYPEWWQGPEDFDGGSFVFFLDSSSHGGVGFPGAGSANFYRTADGWEMRGDYT